MLSIIIAKAKNIALVCHANPDGDTLGSGLALYYAIKSMGKSVDIFCSKVCGLKSVSARHIWQQGGSERRGLADIPIAICRVFCIWVHRYNINNNEVVVSIIPTVWECFWRRSIVGEYAPSGGEFAVVGILDNSAAVLFIGDTYWVDTGILIYIAHGSVHWTANKP